MKLFTVSTLFLYSAASATPFLVSSSLLSIALTASSVLAVPKINVKENDNGIDISVDDDNEGDSKKLNRLEKEIDGLLEDSRRKRNSKSTKNSVEIKVNGDASDLALDVSPRSKTSRSKKYVQKEEDDDDELLELGDKALTQDSDYNLPAFQTSQSFGDRLRILKYKGRILEKKRIAHERHLEILKQKAAQLKSRRVQEISRLRGVRQESDKMEEMKADQARKLKRTEEKGFWLKEYETNQVTRLEKLAAYEWKVKSARQRELKKLRQLVHAERRIKHRLAVEYERIKISQEGDLNQARNFEAFI